MSKKLYRVSTYANKFGYRREMVYYWINKGELPSERIDGVVFVVHWEREKEED